MTEDFWQKLADHGGSAFPTPRISESACSFSSHEVSDEEMGRAVMPGPFFRPWLLGGGAQSSKRVLRPAAMSGCRALLNLGQGASP